MVYIYIYISNLSQGIFDILNHELKLKNDITVYFLNFFSSLGLDCIQPEILLFNHNLWVIKCNPTVYESYVLIDSQAFSAAYTFFYKKLGSGHSTESFLISHEIFSNLVLRVS